MTSTASMVGRGLFAGVAGTAVMTAFQKFVEMPLTGRANSYAPAELVQKLLPVHPDSDAELDRLNYTAHFALGGMWGTAYSIAARAGLRGQRAVAVVFGVVYTGDLLFNTALGLYQPSAWSRQDWAVDIIDKYVQASATGAIYDRFLRS